MSLEESFHQNTSSFPPPPKKTKSKTTTTKNIKSLYWRKLRKVMYSIIQPLEGPNPFHSDRCDNFHIHTFSAPKVTSSAGNLFKCFTILYPGKVFPGLNNPYFKDFRISYPRHHGTQIFPFLFAETSRVLKHPWLNNDQFSNDHFQRLYLSKSYSTDKVI